MLSFITYKNAPEQIEIIIDEKGADELISYLQNAKEQKNHMHLLVGNELNIYPIPINRKEEVFLLNM